MYVREWGNGKKIALLLHGLASSSETWTKLSEDLVSDGFKVYAPDLPGHGESPRFEKYSIEKWEKQIVDTFPHVDLLIGHSLGGLLASKIRTQVQAKRTILIDPVFRLPKSFFLPTTQLVFKMILQAYGIDPKIEESMRTAISQWDRSTVRELRTLKGIDKPDSTTLILRCKGSFITPISLLKKLDGVKYVTIPNSGHNIHLDNYPDMKKEMEEFLSDPEAIFSTLTQEIPVITSEIYTLPEKGSTG